MQERFKTFTVLIANISHSIRKIKSQEMAALDLKGNHVSCLYYLYKSGSMTATELCEICSEDKANISRSIKDLENKGYLASRSKVNKKYQAPLCLTEKGLETGKYIAEKIDGLLIRAGEGLDEEKRTVLYEALYLINDNLQNICDGYENNDSDN